MQVIFPRSFSEKSSQIFLHALKLAITNISGSQTLDQKILWHQLFHDTEFKKNILHIDNEHQHNWPEKLLYEIGKFHFINKLSHRPKIEISAPGTNLQDVKLALSIHTGFSPVGCIAKLLKKNYFTISNYKQAVNAAFLISGLSKINANLIKRDKYVLLNIKNKINDNHIISSTVDFRSNIPGPYNSISPVMFDFIKKVHPLTHFVGCTVDTNGTIKISALAADLKSTNLLYDFICFQEKIRPHALYNVKIFNRIKQESMIHSRKNHKVN